MLKTLLSLSLSVFLSVQSVCFAGEEAKIPVSEIQPLVKELLTINEKQANRLRSQMLSIESLQAKQIEYEKEIKNYKEITLQKEHSYSKLIEDANKQLEKEHRKLNDSKHLVWGLCGAALLGLIIKAK